MRLSHIKVEFLPPPTRFFSVGERVVIGALEGCYVEEVLHDGKVYAIKHEGKSTVVPDPPVKRKGKGQPVEPEKDCWAWTEVYPYRESEPATLFDTYELRYASIQTSVEGLFTRVYKFGVDANPVYQRPYVWDEADKVRLIETIFDHGSIGTFTFNCRDYNFQGALYEVVDGKQRLKALTDYYEGQFAVRGRRYVDLSRGDQYAFRNTSVTVLDTERAKEVDLLRLFLRVNRAGRPVDEAHIHEVRQRLETILAAAAKK